MTVEFRNQILTCVTSSSLSLTPTVGQGNPSSILATLQQLYASLSFGLESFVEPETFHKSLLKVPWGDKQQQDSYQFLLYLWETLGMLCVLVFHIFALE